MSRQSLAARTADRFGRCVVGGCLDRTPSASRQCIFVSLSSSQSSTTALFPGGRPRKERIVHHPGLTRNRRRCNCGGQNSLEHPTLELEAQGECAKPDCRMLLTYVAPERRISLVTLKLYDTYFIIIRSEGIWLMRRCLLINRSATLSTTSG